MRLLIISLMMLAGCSKTLTYKPCVIMEPVEVEADSGEYMQRLDGDQR